MNVLSLFDGISCGMVALEREGIKVDNYFSSEIDKSALTVSNNNYPGIIRLGDINNFKSWDLPKIDLIIGGSPCQDFSIARTTGTGCTERDGLNGERSGLFYVYLDILMTIKCFNPNVKFLLENVRMKKECELELNDYMRVDGVHINSNLVSFQNRPRIYWTNICELKQPLDKNINFQNHKDTDNKYCDIFKVNRTPSREKMWLNGNGNGGNAHCKNITNSKKVNCLTVKQDRAPNSGLIAHGDFCRYLTTHELEQAQTLPKGYTKGISKNQSEKVLGNGWTVDVVAHIFKELK